MKENQIRVKENQIHVKENQIRGVVLEAFLFFLFALVNSSSNAIKSVGVSECFLFALGIVIPPIIWIYLFA
ncbi:hypothetical protein HMPREF0352_2728 [Enterococcus faecium TX1330]|nr:hypothetical protein HMPREF0352_2728 [Enterococcus faecium TX1330]